MHHKTKLNVRHGQKRPQEFYIFSIRPANGTTHCYAEQGSQVVSAAWVIGHCLELRGTPP